MVGPTSPKYDDRIKREHVVETIFGPKYESIDPAIGEIDRTMGP